MSNNDHRRHTATCLALIEPAMLVTDTRKRPNTLYLNVVVRKKRAENKARVLVEACTFFLFSSFCFLPRACVIELQKTMHEKHHSSP